MRTARVLLAFLCLAFTTTGYAQYVGTGLYALGSFDHRGFDTINLGTLNTHFEIPMVTKKGRGLDFVYTLEYDGLIWAPVTSNGIVSWMPDTTWGFRGQLAGGVVGYITYAALQLQCGEPAPQQPGHPAPLPPTNIRFSNYVYHDPLGATHAFKYTRQTACSDGSSPASTSGDGSTSDSSGYSLNLPGNNAKRPDYSVSTLDGKLIVTPVSTTPSSGAGSITDHNGNVITKSSNGTYVDTTGNTFLTISGSGTASSPLVYTYPTARTSNGATSSFITVYYRTYQIHTAFNCGPGEYNQANDLVDHIVFPDAAASTYTFTYETTPGGTSGRLASVTLPAGGKISYTYSGGCSGGINGDGTPQTLVRTTSDGSKTYNRAINGTAASNGQAYDESGNRTDFSFRASANGNTYETGRTVYAGNPGSGAVPLYDRTTIYGGQSGSASIPTPITQTDTYEVFSGSNSNGTEQLRTTNVYTATGLLTSSTPLDTGAGTIQIVSNKFQYEPFGSISSATGYDANNNLVTSTTYGFDEDGAHTALSVPQHTSPVGYRGNRTSSHVLTSTNTTLDTTMTYDDAGQLRTVSTLKASGSTTPVGTTSYSYDPATDTFLIGTTLPTPSSGIALATSATFNAATGIQQDQTGLNTDKTTFDFYDGLLRPTQSTAPSGSQTTVSYSPKQISSSSVMDASGRKTTQIIGLDGYGRPNRTATDRGGTYYIVDSCYGPTGLLRYSGQPYTSTTLPATQNCGGGDAYLYDGLSRMTSITHADGSSSTWFYQGRAVRQTDSPGTTTITQMDLIGRTSAICEVTSKALVTGGITDSPGNCNMDIGGTGFLTKLSYDLPNHKVSITQGSQPPRVFQTDAAGRQTMSQELESGTTNYGYAHNATGLVVTRTRPQANIVAPDTGTTTTITQYDLLDRPLTISYTNSNTSSAAVTTPPKTFTYDVLANNDVIPNGGGSVKGQLTSAATGEHARQYAYNIIGTVSQTVECLPDWCSGSTHTVYRAYGYDYLGNLTSDKYATVANAGFAGASATISYGYNLAGQLISIGGGQNDAANPTIYGADQPSMLPFGPQKATFGNGLVATSQYDGVGRESGRWLCGPPGGVNCPSPSTYSFGFAVQRSGNQTQWETDTTINRFTDYSYDDLGRLTGGTSHSGQDGLNYSATYDRYGNRWSQTVTNVAPGANTPTASNFTFNQAANQISTLSYDGAGNLRNDGPNTYTYDAENNLIGITGGTTAIYAYDAFSHKVKANVNGQVDRYGLDLAGRRSTTWADNSTALKLVQYYSLSGPVAFWAATDGHIHFEHGDWLGSDHIRTSTTGVTDASFAAAPFGELVSGGLDLAPGHFAQLDQDSVATANLSHAAFREYSSYEGRWTSPDPDQGSYDPSNPQSMNRYSYALNSPLSLSDPLGLTPIDPCATNPNCVTSYAGGDTSGCLYCNYNTNTSGSLPWWMTEYGTYGQPGGQCLLSNGGVTTCPNPQAASPAPTKTKNLAPSKPQNTRNPNLPNCYAVEAAVFFGDLNPFSPGYSTVTGLAGEAMNSASAAKSVTAAIYAATTINTKGGIGLLQPLKSSTYRGVLADASILSKAALALNLLTIDAAAVHAAYAAATTPCQVP